MNFKSLLPVVALSALTFTSISHADSGKAQAKPFIHDNHSPIYRSYSNIDKYLYSKRPDFDRYIIERRNWKKPMERDMFTHMLANYGVDPWRHGIYVKGSNNVHPWIRQAFEDKREQVLEHMLESGHISQKVFETRIQKYKELKEELNTLRTGQINNQLRARLIAIAEVLNSFRTEQNKYLAKNKSLNEEVQEDLWRTRRLIKNQREFNRLISASREYSYSDSPRYSRYLPY